MKTLIIGSSDSDWIKKVQKLGWANLVGDPAEIERIKNLLLSADIQTKWSQIIYDEMIEELTKEELVSRNKQSKAKWNIG